MVVAADLNADGILDLVVANDGSGRVSVLLGNGSGGHGNGTFATQVTYTTGTNPFAIAVADFNADSVPDLAVANYGSNNVTISLGNGNGTFAAAVGYSVGTQPRFVASGDFNADGIVDLAVANNGNSNVGVLLGDGSGGRGDGTFATQVTYPTGTNPWCVAVGDYSGDGILDLAVSNYSSDNVSVLLGDGSAGRGDGTFAGSVNYAVGDMPLYLTKGDFNEDGILDLAVSNSGTGSNTLSILRGQGNGTFANLPPSPYATGTYPFGIATGDYNGDGILDLAIANYNSASISVFIGIGSAGHGDGTFAARANYTSGSNPWSIAAGDFNADGFLDLVVTSKAANNVQLFTGDGTCQ